MGSNSIHVVHVDKSDSQNHYNISVTADRAALQPLPPLKHSSTLFTGRDEYLQRLRSYFSCSTQANRKSFLLYGLGGIGKTQICLKFIEQNVDL